MQEILGLAAVQYGLFTATQWTDAGLSRRSLTRRKAPGEVREVHPGVFAFAGAPVSQEQRVLAACLSVGGVASHRCAAHLWGFRRFEKASAVEVLTAKQHTPARDAVRVRRTGYLDSADIDEVRGIPVTSRVRTLLDLCDVNPQLAEGAINGALHRRWVSVRQLEAVLGRVGPKHPGLVRYRELVLPFTAGQRPTESDLKTTFSSL